MSAAHAWLGSVRGQRVVPLGVDRFGQGGDLPEVAPALGGIPAETLREDLDSRGPVRVSEVEAEQKELMKIVRRLVDEGQIVLASGGADEFV